MRFSLSLFALVPLLVAAQDANHNDRDAVTPHGHKHVLPRAAHGHVRRGKCKVRSSNGTNDASASTTSTAATVTTLPAKGWSSDESSSLDASATPGTNSTSADPTATNSSDDQTQTTPPAYAAVPPSSSLSSLSTPPADSSTPPASLSTPPASPSPSPTPDTSNNNNSTDSDNSNGDGSDDPRGSGPWTGTATFFTAGQNNCGGYDDPMSSIVAVHKSLYDRWPGYDSQDDISPVCNRMLSITWKGQTVQAKVTDSCPTCSSENDLDLSQGTFYQFFDGDAGAAEQAGILPDMVWNWV